MDWLLNLPVAAMAVVILAGSYVVTWIIYLVVTRLAKGERARAFKAISPGMLPPLAVVFALLVGFLAAQVWSDADRASTAVNREASALRGAARRSPSCSPRWEMRSGCRSPSSRTMRGR